MTLRQAARRLTAIAVEVRDVAGSVDGPGDARFAIARDLRATAFTIDRIAASAERAGRFAGEPDPDGEIFAGVGAAAGAGPTAQAIAASRHWPVDHEYGE